MHGRRSAGGFGGYLAAGLHRRDRGGAGRDGAAPHLPAGDLPAGEQDLSPQRPRGGQREKGYRIWQGNE
nr:MAG TPA: hypothetical protein [Caudoviricetes sp.]